MVRNYYYHGYLAFVLSGYSEMNSANVALVLHLHTPYNIKEEEKKNYPYFLHYPVHPFVYHFNFNWRDSKDTNVYKKYFLGNLLEKKIVIISVIEKGKLTK